MTEIRFNEQVIARLADSAPVRAALSRIAAELVNEMKRRCPVSKQLPVYARPLPLGSSSKAGKPRARYGGDLPLRPSGYLRSSCRAEWQGDGSVIVGAFASYARYVTEGTRPHEIRSHGPWPLRNRQSGQIFGRVVHHPGTRAQPFVYEAAEAIRARYAGRGV